MSLIEISEAILKGRILLEGENFDGMVDRVVDALSLDSVMRKMLSGLYFLPNSPCLMNAGTDIGQLCACFVLPIEDSIEGIFGTLKDMALVQKSGGGTGFSFNNIRPEGSRVGSTGGVASGPVSFLRIFNAATNEVKQGGRRRGASMAVLNVDHPDALKFIRCKGDTGEITNFNISVGVSNAFMENVRDNSSKAAREVWDEVVKNAWETGEPGILFLDTINQGNPTPEVGRIEACNPCGETVLLPYEACVLGSIDLAKFVEGGKINYGRLVEVVSLAVKFLDKVIDISKYPLPQIEEMTKANRKIGLGVMGWANMLYKLGIPYNSSKALDIAGKVMGFINEAARETSEELAEMFGVFPNFSNSIYKSRKPRRNAAVTSIAPTGTIADIAGTSYGIEPEYALVYIKKILGGREFLKVNPIFEDELRKRGLYKEDILEKIRANGGSVRGLREIPDDMQEIFVVAHDLEPKDHVLMQGIFQVYVEQSISKTINLPRVATLKDVEDVYMLAWEAGCKGCTVYRDGARPEQVLSSKYVPSERPAILEGQTHKFKTGCGSLYITVNKDLAGEVHEVFASHSQNSGCVSALLNALARVTSIALRSGVDPNALIGTMLGQTCGKCDGISSCADALGIALRGGVNKNKCCEEDGVCEFCG